MKARAEDLADRDRANERFVAELERYALRYRCEDCEHLVPGNRSCSLGYPNEMLRGPHRAIDARGRITFCKYFELA